MLFFISPVSLTLFASSRYVGHLVTNGADIFPVSITLFHDRRPLPPGCTLCTQREEGEGMETRAEEKGLGFFPFIFTPPSLLPKYFPPPSPCSGQHHQKYSRGQAGSIPCPSGHKQGDLSLFRDRRCRRPSPPTSISATCMRFPPSMTGGAGFTFIYFFFFTAAIFFKDN